MHALDIADQTGPIVVTLIYLALYYAFQIRQLQVKTRLGREYLARGEKFDRYFSQDREMLAADRTQLNMLEHMPPFLALFWLNAVFVGPGGATIAGGLYVAARALYPLVLGRRLGRGIRAQVLISTGTGYAVLAYFMGALVWQLLA
ncbi:hypothetical protein DB30_00983 [Enhygromyxa salina]|uniref:MAPEG family protein n=1 Tax=Enhygromyxa salina TaxID=215803 RepID=A0A0C2CT87_9BACT|nr:MAPEG family protein [Enhygromyxa salina]KIG12820.1 hypothetical protein DB30_00983 [Enhygromyxa salina]